MRATTHFTTHMPSQLTPRHPVTDPGFITLCIQLAQATFSEVMPARSDSGDPSPRAKANAGRSAKGPNWIERLDNWFYRQQLNAREDYLAQSTDIFDLEQRIRYLERRPYY